MGWLFFKMTARLGTAKKKNKNQKDSNSCQHQHSPIKMIPSGEKTGNHPPVCHQAEWPHSPSSSYWIQPAWHDDPHRSFPVSGGTTGRTWACAEEPPILLPRHKQYPLGLSSRYGLEPSAWSHVHPTRRLSRGWTVQTGQNYRSKKTVVFTGTPRRNGRHLQMDVWQHRNIRRHRWTTGWSHTCN